jgi:hypothetical protein
MGPSRTAPVCVALIALVATACGGTHAAGGKRSAAAPASSAVASKATAGTAGSDSTVPGARRGRSVRPARMFSQADLEAVTIGPKDLPGWRMGTIQGRGGDGVRVDAPVADVSRFPHIPQRACEPLLYMAQYVSRHQYHASVQQTVATGSGDSETLLTASLKSYAVADAPKVMSDLRSALASCTSFASLEEGERWTEVTALADPGLGDEAVACRMTLITPSVDSEGDEDGGPPAHTRFAFTVVRSGAVIATFETFASPYRPDVQVPMKPVTVQISKLAGAR